MAGQAAVLTHRLFRRRKTRGAAVAARVVIVVAVLAAGLAGAAPAAAAPTCTFTLGFRALRDLIPAQVGDCLEPEHFNPANGNAEQRTTAWHGRGGLLVWRKADNWTAFTDGATTWVNGPRGLQKRTNGETFAWEAAGAAADQSAPIAPVDPTVCTLSSDAVAIAQPVVQPDGSLLYRASVRNTCATTSHVMIDAWELRPGADNDGRPLVDVPTAFVQDLSPNETRSIEVRAPAGPRGPRRVWRSVAVTGDGRDQPCVAVGATHCLRVDPWLHSAVVTLMDLDEGRALLRRAADLGVRLTREPTEIGVGGWYTPRTRTVAIAIRLDAYSSWVRAAVLAHELRHAVDIVEPVHQSRASCLQSEEDAFRQQGRVWSQLWRGSLPESLDRVHAELNRISRDAESNPAALAGTIAADYLGQCGAEER